MNDNVIITTSWKSNNRSYHTTNCRKVSAIKHKKYITIQEAQQMGMQECQYCSGEFEPSNGDNTIYKLAKKIGEENAKAH